MIKYIILFARHTQYIGMTLNGDEQTNIDLGHNAADVVPYGTLGAMCKAEDLDLKELRKVLKRKGTKFPLIFEGCFINKIEINR